MRNAGWALLVLSVIAAEVRGQDTGAWADKLFSERTHDFGNVARGAELFHEFKIKNIYAVPLQVIDTRVECSCVTVLPGIQLPESRQTVQALQPNQEGVIQIKMDGRRFTG